jgi:hypothetical protein
MSTEFIEGKIVSDAREVALRSIIRGLLLGGTMFLLTNYSLLSSLLIFFRLRISLSVGKTEKCLLLCTSLWKSYS